MCRSEYVGIFCILYIRVCTYIIESDYIEYQKFLFRYLTIKKNIHRISSDAPLQSLLSPSDVFPSPSSLPIHWRGVDPYERQKIDFLKGFTK